METVKFSSRPIPKRKYMNHFFICFLVLILVSFSAFAHRPANAESLVNGFSKSRYLMVFMMQSEKANGPEAWQVILSDADGKNPVAITSGQYPRIDASGGQIAFSQGADEQGLSIMMKDLKTGAAEQWTPEDGMNTHPRFSGNGRYLAFTGPLGPGKKAQIGIIDLETARKSAKPERNAQGITSYKISPRVIDSEYESYFPTISSDGSFVVFQRTKGKADKDIVLFDLTNNRLEEITKEKGEWMSPSLSFDDRWVAYTGKKDGKWDIYMTNLLTKETLRVTHGVSSELSPAFRPDGSLVFSSERSGHFELYEISSEEMKGRSFQNRPLVLGGGQHYAPSVSGNITFYQKSMPDMPGPGRDSFGAIKVGNRFYIAGGHQGHEHTYAQDTFLSTFEYFDLMDNKWHKAAPLPVPCLGFGLASNGKYIYAFGGFAYSADHKPAWQSLDIIQRYDIKNDRWEKIGKMPRGRSSYALAQIGTNVYLLGGWDSTPKNENDKEGRFLREVDAFDLTTEKMTPDVARIPDPLRRAVTAAVLENEIVLLGGIGVGASHFSFLDNVTAFNPQTGLWRELPRLPFATFAPTAGVIGNKLFIFGGMVHLAEDNDIYVNHIFELEHGKWAHTGRYLKESKGFSQIVNWDPQTLGIIGGQSYFPVKNAAILTFELFGLRSAKDFTP